MMENQISQMAMMTNQTQQPEIKEHSLQELNLMYNECESVDNNAFAEMRSNILLVSGDHYAKRNHQILTRIRSSRNIPENQKVRIVMNHIGRITDLYANAIISAAPGVSFAPKTAKELSDIKAAELHEAVWKDAKQRYRLDEVFDDEVDNYITLGEEWAVMKWNPNAGKIKDGTSYIDATSGMPVYVPGEAEGAFEIETPYAFDMLFDAKAKESRAAKYFIQRKLSAVSDLKKMFPEVESKIKEGRDQTFKIFDTVRGEYRADSDEDVTVKEFYFKPSARYPKGYFYMLTTDVILAKGELPFGVFPVVGQMFKKIATHRRGLSIIKRLRPYQIEINRAWSKMAEHQITLGDDKVLLMNGTTVSDGMQRPGIDFVNVTGEAPITIAGRDGSQFLNTALATVEQMYKNVDLAEEETANMQDAFAILYKSASQKKKFRTYIKRHERFLKDFTILYATLAKNYLSDDYVIQAVSRSEAINIPEFKNSLDINTQITVEEQNEDLETKFGKQLSLQQTLQYVGSKLSPEQVGALLRESPFGCSESVTSDLTLKVDTATNVILSLDRGTDLQTSKYVDHDYMIQRLEKRMTEADFLMLPPQTQMLYEQRKAFHTDMKAQNIIELQRVEQGLIPTGGGLVSMDFYVPDPNSPNKLMRAKAPQQAIAWMFGQLDAQKWVLDPMINESQGSHSEIAQKAFPVQQSAAQGPGNPWQANTNPGKTPMAI